MPQMDVTTYTSQIVWLVITFAVLFFVMSKVIVPKISATLEARKKRLDDNIDQAAEFKKQAEAAIEAYDKKLAAARDQAHAAIAEVRDAAAAERTAREAELGKALAARISEAEATIAKAKDDAIANLRDTAVDVAQAVAERISGEAPDPAKVGQAVDNALKA